MDSDKQQYVELSSGYKMPLIGLGTWLSKSHEVEESVKIALLNGYKLIDCAQAYQNQKDIGNALKSLFAKGKVKREDVFIASKVWNTFHSHDLAIKAVDEILNDLQLDYLDLGLIHWPMGFKEGGEFFPKVGEKMLYSEVDYLETWQALEIKLKEKKIRSIGVSNFNASQIQRIIDNGTIKPAILQIELHPFFQQKQLVKFCHDNSIHVMAYSPLANPAMPFRKEGDPSILDHPYLNELAKKYNKTNPQIVLRALVQKQIAVIPKSVKEHRIKENFNIWDFLLTNEEMEQFEKLDVNKRLLDLEPRDGSHPHFPWKNNKI